MANTPTPPRRSLLPWTVALAGMWCGYLLLNIVSDYIDRKYQHPFLHATTFIPTPPQEPARLSVWVFGPCIDRDESLDRNALRQQACRWNCGLHLVTLMLYIIPLAWCGWRVGRYVSRWEMFQPKPKVLTSEQADYDDQPFQSPQPPPT